MVERVVWSPNATENFEKTVAYIEGTSAHYAALFARKIIELTEQLADFPKLGRVVPEYNRDDLREIFHGSYRIIYRVQKDFVEIAALSHSSRLLKNTINISFT